MKNYVTTASLEPRAGEIRRIIKMAAFAKIIPIGNIGGGPGFRCLINLFVVHSLGAPFFTVLIRIEPFLARLYQRLQRARQDNPGDSGQ